MENKTKASPLKSPCGCRAKPYQVKFCPLHDAAPELLAALKALYQNELAELGMTNEQVLGGDMLLARAAIKKAQGGRQDE
jgi:hypothetical protein